MTRYIVIFFSFFLISSPKADIKEKIIQNLKNTTNLDFKFEQNINGKIENGNCTLEYPKKIFCEYANNNNKILVSNGKSLVVKSRSSYYRYPLERTPLNLILDKKYLINKISNLEERIVNKSLINLFLLLRFAPIVFNTNLNLKGSKMILILSKSSSN